MQNTQKHSYTERSLKATSEVSFIIYFSLPHEKYILSLFANQIQVTFAPLGLWVQLLWRYCGNHTLDLCVQNLPPNSRKRSRFGELKSHFS